jgi:outer membrane protein
VLIALQVLLSAQSDLLLSQANLFKGQYALMASIGLVSASYLHLDVPVYDVNAYYDAVKNAPATSFQGKQLDKIMELIDRD